MRGQLRDRRWLYWGERMRAQTRAEAYRSNTVGGSPYECDRIVAIGTAAEQDYRNRFPNVQHCCIPYHCD